MKKAPIEPYLPEFFVPFTSRDERHFGTGLGIPVDVCIDPLMLPNQVRDHRTVHINIGALGAVAAACKIDSVYVLKNDDDEGAQINLIAQRNIVNGGGARAMEKKPAAFIAEVSKRKKELNIFYNPHSAQQCATENTSRLTSTDNPRIWSGMLNSQLALALKASGVLPDYLPFLVKRYKMDEQLRRTRLFDTRHDLTLSLPGAVR